MSACEKCWATARMLGVEYHEVLDDRRRVPCTPEEQAGPDATDCEKCGRRTRHQHTRECMACFDDPKREALS